MAYDPKDLEYVLQNFHRLNYDRVKRLAEVVCEMYGTPMADAMEFVVLDLRGYWPSDYPTVKLITDTDAAYRSYLTGLEQLGLS